jgi:predicted transcriptional regulator
MMNKNVGRAKPEAERDAKWADYKRVLPGTVGQVAERLGLSLRRAEKSLGTLRGLGLVRQVREVFEYDERNA